MKKLILFLLLPLWAIAQTTTGQEQEFDYGIKNNSTQTITTPPYLTTTGMDGTQGKIPSAYIAKTADVADSLGTKANDSEVVKLTGNQTKTGVLTLTDGATLGDNTGVDKTLLSLPSLTTLKFTKQINNLYDFNIDQSDPDSFFLTSKEGTARQSLYFGDANNSHNYFGLSSSVDFGATWKNSFAVNATGNVGINNNNPQTELDVAGALRGSGEITSNTSISIAKIAYNVTDTSPNLPVNLDQGYTFDGTFHYFFGTNRIAKLDYQYNVIASNENPLNGIPGVDHLGDGVYLNGFLYAPVEAYPSVTGMKIAKYDASTLALVTTYDISAQNHEVSSIATDGITLYVSSYLDGTKIFKYSLIGSYLGAINITTPLTNNIQGISYWKNNFYIVEQTKLSKVSFNGDTTTFLRDLPGDVGNTHRGEGIQVVNGELRIGIINLGVTAVNLYSLNSKVSPIKEFNANSLGEVTATKFVDSNAPDNSMLKANGTNSTIFNTDSFVGFGTSTGVGTDYLSIFYNSSLARSQAVNIKDVNASASGSVFYVFRKSDDTYLGDIKRSGTDDALYIGGNSFLSLGSGGIEKLRLSSSDATFSSTVTATSFNGSATLTGTPTAPTAAPGTTGNQIATLDYVKNGFVDLTGNQTITGVKTFANSSNSRGIYSYNTSTGSGIYSENIAGGVGLHLNNFSGGDNIVSNNSATGTGFNYVGQNQDINTFTVDKLGNITGQKIIANNVVRLKNYTVATLPVGVQGDTAFVTDALAPTYMATVVGGGAVVCPVFYNGTAWVAH